MTSEELVQAIETLKAVRDENYEPVKPDAFTIPADGFSVLTEAVRLLRLEAEKRCSLRVD